MASRDQHLARQRTLQMFSIFNSAQSIDATVAWKHNIQSVLVSSLHTFFWYCESMVLDIHRSALDPHSYLWVLFVCER